MNFKPGRRVFGALHGNRRVERREPNHHRVRPWRARGRRPTEFLVSGGRGCHRRLKLNPKAESELNDPAESIFPLRDAWFHDGHYDCRRRAVGEAMRIHFRLHRAFLWGLFYVP